MNDGCSIADDTLTVEVVTTGPGIYRVIIFVPRDETHPRLPAPTQDPNIDLAALHDLGGNVELHELEVR